MTWVLGGEEKEEFKGHPSIKFFPKGSVEAEVYDGGRSADTIVQWVNDKVGTTRRAVVLESDPPSTLFTYKHKIERRSARKAEVKTDSIRRGRLEVDSSSRY